MKYKTVLSPLVLLLLICSLNSCKTYVDNVEAKAISLSATIDVELCPGNACCNNIRVANGTKIAGPNSCDGYNALYVVNLEEFGLDNINDCNQIRTIEYKLLEECEAIGEKFDCLIVCDLIHGLPIEIVKVMD